MRVYCHDCDHWFVEHPIDTELDLMECPFCEGANWSAYAEDLMDSDRSDPLAYVEDWEDR